MTQNKSIKLIKRQIIRGGTKKKQKRNEKEKKNNKEKELKASLEIEKLIEKNKEEKIKKEEKKIKKNNKEMKKKIEILNEIYRLNNDLKGLLTTYINHINYMIKDPKYSDIVNNIISKLTWELNQIYYRNKSLDKKVFSEVLDYINKLEIDKHFDKGTTKVLAKKKLELLKERLHKLCSYKYDDSYDDSDDDLYN